MYTSYFGLAEKPFAITPDPRYLFLSERHAEALAHLLYGIEDAGGFVQLTGEVGTGKTTMVRSLLAQLPPHVDLALILNPRVTPAEFLLAICDELHVGVPEESRGSVKVLVDALNRFLLDAHARGRRVVVIVDEAQQLASDVLEQVRLLTNLETETRKLLQIILVGQPELRDLLARTDLRQLAQRITGRYHLDPLSRVESAAYARHRLKVAGATREIFAPGALAELHRLSNGIPRVINVIADRALLGAYTGELERVTPALVRRAAGEVYGRAVTPPWAWWSVGALGTAAAAVVAFGLWHALDPAGRAANDVALAADAAPASTPAPASAPAPTTGGVVPGEAAEAARPTLTQFLGTHAAVTDTDRAFTRLFALWQVPLAADAGRPCEQALEHGLECLAQRGTLAQLRTLNRPAILALVGPDGVEHQVVMTRLDDARARLEVDGTAHEADLAELQRWWYGDFLLLWRPPLPGVRTLTPGMRGAEVRWLRQGLQQVRGLPHQGPDVYDRELVRLVEDFQRSHRLTVDGIAGQQTQAALDGQLGGPGAPTLRASGG